MSTITAVGEGKPFGTAHRALRALAWLGADVRFRVGAGEWITDDLTRVTIEPAPAVGPMATAQEYVGLAAAIALVSGGPRTVKSEEVGERLVEGAVPGAGCEPVRCADGWLIARWRDPLEASLLDRRLGGPLDRCARDDIWAAATECRLLVAPVRDRPRGITDRLNGLSGSGGGEGRLRVVDWSSLWAGPWAAGSLAARGHRVMRIEVAGRPDGLLQSDVGRAIWRRFNAGKEIEWLDARTPAGLQRLREVLREADLLIDGNTPRVREQLGVGEEWLARHAPRLSVISLRAFDGPQSASPGLGDMGAAVAGLLWLPDGAPPQVMPWADPLAGAWVLLLAQAWQRAGRPGGWRAVISLEHAASAAVSSPPLMTNLAYPACGDTEREKAGIA